ncbi:MAG: hypothetical protein ACYC4R_11620 [Anaerolineae bacterium]
MASVMEAFDQFHADLLWPSPEWFKFLLYVIRPRAHARVGPPDLSGWPEGTRLKSFELFDDPWPVIVELYEIYPPVLPCQAEQRLLDALAEMCERGAVISFYMFDGNLGDISDLFSGSVAQGTYGVAIPGQVPHLQMDPHARAEAAWADLLDEAAEYLYRLFPDLKRLYRNHDST